MKQAKWLLLVAVGILLVLPGCKQLGSVPVKAANTVADPLVVPILAGQTIPVGNIKMWNDANYVYIDYVLDTMANEADQWYLKECQADIQRSPDAFPQKNGNPQPGQFAYVSGDISYTIRYTFTIPVGEWDGTVCVATHCVVTQLDELGGEINGNTGWAGPNEFPGKNWATYFWYTFGGGGGGGGWEWETSWAGDADDWTRWQFLGNNWALYVVYDYATGADLVGDMYAGNPKNGEVVCGTLTVHKNADGSLAVTYDTDDVWNMLECHLQVATTLNGIPQRNGNPIPGRFELYAGQWAEPFQDAYAFTVPYDEAWGSTLYIAAHSVVGMYVVPPPGSAGNIAAAE